MAIYQPEYLSGQQSETLDDGTTFKFTRRTALQLSVTGNFTDSPRTAAVNRELKNLGIPMPQKFSTEPAAPRAQCAHFVTMRADLPIGEQLTGIVSDACAFASIGKTKLYELINDGALAMTRIGRRRLVIVSSLKTLLGDEQCAAAPKVL